jgi:hypothetical protein
LLPLWSSSLATLAAKNSSAVFCSSRHASFSAGRHFAVKASRLRCRATLANSSRNAAHLPSKELLVKSSQTWKSSPVGPCALALQMFDAAAVLGGRSTDLAGPAVTVARQIVNVATAYVPRRGLEVMRRCLEYVTFEAPSILVDVPDWILLQL